MKVSVGDSAAMRSMVSATTAIALSISCCVRTPRMGSQRTPHIVCADPADSAADMLIKNLLCQRSVQTQMRYFRDFRNDFANEWLLRFSEERMGCRRLANGQAAAAGILHFHDAMGSATWSTYLIGMLESPEETHTIEVVGSRIGGGSPNNPYLQDRQVTKTYTDTVKPVQIYNTVLRIREVLASEWREDLALIEQDNAELRRHHAEEVKNVVDEQERFQNAIRPRESGDDGMESSPLRIASYDLLKNAATQVALRRLFSELDGEPTQRSQAEWIRSFMSKEGSALSDPNAGWHVARALPPPQASVSLWL